MNQTLKLSTTAILTLCGLAALYFSNGSLGQDRVMTIGPGIVPARDEAPVSVPQPPPPPAPEKPADMPVGSVAAWLKNLTNTPPLAPEWAECNGQTLDHPGSPYHGQPLPDLNGAIEAQSRFLRGAAQSGDAGGSDIHRHGNFLISRAGDRNVNISAWTPASHLPPYYTVVWIIKVR